MALREARRRLRPGGRLALMGWTREHMEQDSPRRCPHSLDWPGSSPNHPTGRRTASATQ
jgi:hypothetical protein